MPTIRIRPATPEDLPAVLALLKDCGLPNADLNAASLGHFLIAGDDAAGNLAIIGIAGIEPYGKDALLRSVAVRAEYRSTGLGRQLADAAEEYARKAGITTLYLLTTTAPDYFARRNYVAIARADAPASLQASAEFSSLCPSQAACMKKDLQPTR